MLPWLLLLMTSQVPVPAAAPEPFCPPGWETLRNDACLLKGEQPGLVVYFHGMSAPSVKTLAWELSFPSRIPPSRRTSLVVLRGVAGLCDWADEYRSWWCWPTAKSRVPETQTVIDRLDDVVAAAGERLHHQGLPVIAGYSNGGYLVSMLMGEPRVVASGWVVMHGGPITGVAYAKDHERPTLLMAAIDDGIQRPAMEGLKAKLDSTNWKSALVLRPGGHPPEVEDYQRLFEFAAQVSRSP